MLNLISDISVYYNFKTSEMNGDGLYVLHPELKQLSLSVLSPIELRLEEEQLITLENPNFEV